MQYVFHSKTNPSLKIYANTISILRKIVKSSTPQPLIEIDQTGGVEASVWDVLAQGISSNCGRTYPPDKVHNFTLDYVQLVFVLKHHHRSHMDQLGNNERFCYCDFPFRSQISLWPVVIENILHLNYHWLNVSAVIVKQSSECDA